MIKGRRMNWKNFSEKINEKKINLQINFPLFEKNIYGIFKRKDIFQIFVLTEICTIIFNLFFIFAVGNLLYALFTPGFENNYFLKICSNFFLIAIPISLLVLSQIIKIKIEKMINIIEKTHWEFLNENDLYKLRLILTLFWVDEALRNSNFLIEDLRKSIQKKYQHYYIKDSLEIEEILKKIHHQTEEGSIIL
jgi:hypothetical protein